MLIKEVVVSRSYKINLGNYENVDVFVCMKAELDDFDEGAQTAGMLAVLVEHACFQQIMSVYGARGKKVPEAEARRRHGISC